MQRTKGITYFSPWFHIYTTAYFNEVVAVKWNVDERCIQLARYICETGSTVRAAAKRFGVSKSTVHKDVTTRLKELNKSLYEKTASILKRNKEERHIRGGAATRAKYIDNKRDIQ